MSRARAAAWAAAIALGASVGAAAAQPAPPLAPAPRDEQAPRPAPPVVEEARTLFAAANQRFGDRDFPRAVELYKAALHKWEQPAIRFNLAIALIELDRTREAYLHLELALRQPEALGERAAEARNYLRLLRGRLATVVVTCPRGATCEIDGETLAPGESTLTLEPGSHTLAARQPGYQTTSETLVLEPGRRRHIAVSLERPRVRLVRRWPAWIPWTVIGASALVAASGGASYALGRSDVRTAQDAVDELCRAGCTMLPQADLARADRGYERQQLGVGLLIAGGVLLITGGVIAALNQPEAQGPAVPRTAARARRATWQVGLGPTRGGGLALLEGQF